MLHILYQGLLRSPASWARVGRGYTSALLRLGAHVEAVSSRGFLFDPRFEAPCGLVEVQLEAARRAPPEIGLGFLHPPHADRLLGGLKTNLLVWESDVLPPGWAGSLERACDLVLVPSAFTLEALLRAGFPASRASVVSYGFDPALLDIEPPPSPGPADGPFTFLAVLAPHWRKGVRELLGAYRAAFSSRDDVLLAIKTTYDPGLRRKQQAFEIPSWMGVLEDARLLEAGAPRVRLDVRIAQDSEIPRIYESAHVVVAPAWGESFGLSILEGLAAARPVLATGWGGHLGFLPQGPDVLPHRLVEAGNSLYEAALGARAAIPDVEALRARLRWHFEHPRESREAGEACRQSVKGRTWLRAGQCLLDALTSASGRRG